jgi:hypothetical protein
VHLVRESASSEATTTEAAPSDAEGGGYTVPNVRRRSAWGAGPYHGNVEVASGLSRAVVHHTVNGNGYTASQVPSMLRSIQAYHQGSRGWDDIGYNFVIDRFGTIWEGRASSLYKPVIGAHASNANTGSVGVAYLGDGTTAGLSSTAVNNLGRFLGWKMTLHGARPTSSNIVGHRDVGQSTCPGNIIYGQLGAIRNRAMATDPPPGPFFDVPNSSPRAVYLRWGRNNGVISPLRDGTFHPGQDVTRADTVFWLWRSAGRPAGGTAHGFSDVPANAYYRTALRWARARGIVQASSDGRFRPGRQVTREQYVVQLWRFAGSPNPSVDHNYGDVPGSAPNQVAFDWSDAYGLVPSANFGRGAIMSRAESVLLLYRLRRFDDVPRRHVAFAAITWAQRQVIASGFTGHVFRPSEDMRRSLGVAWIWRMMDRPDSPPPPNDPFNDDDESAGYKAALDWAAEADWVEADDEGAPNQFVPEGPLTRGDAVIWTWRIAGEPATDNEHPFSDAPGPSDLDDALDWGDRYDLVSGFSNGTYRPTLPISRAQFLLTLNRLARKPGAWAADPPTTVLF